MSSKIHYTLHAVCHSYHISPATIAEMVSWGIAKPRGNGPQNWWFDENDIAIIERAFRVGKELNINIPGAALAIQFFDELKDLQEIRRKEVLPAPRMRIVVNNTEKICWSDSKTILS